jgi:hypothetical protein
MSPIESLELVTSPRAQQQPVLGRKNSRCCIQGIKTLAETCTSIGKARDHRLENTVHWSVHRGEGLSHAGQLRTVFTLSQARCEVTVYLSCELAWTKLYIKSEELGHMQRKSHFKNYTKSMYVSGLCQ